MTLERELRQLEKNIETLTAIDLGQLTLAISLGVRLARIENGVALAEKIEAAEQNSNNEPPNVMQKALLQQLDFVLDSSATRADLSYEIIQHVKGQHHKFYHGLDSAFQDRFCGGPLSRFNAVPTFSPTTHGILSVFGMAWRVVKFLFIAVILLFITAILLAKYAPKAKNNPPANGVNTPQQAP